MKNKIVLSLLVFVIIVVLVFCFSIQKIEISEHYLENDSVEITANLNNDGFLDVIRLDVEYENTEDKVADFFKTLFSETPYTLTINNKEFKYMTDNGYRVYSLGVADLNKDNNVEVLIGVINDSISPSYRNWLVYNSEGEFVIKIYDGEMVYNKLLNHLRVKYKLSETKTLMYETCYYKLS